MRKIEKMQFLVVSTKVVNITDFRKWNLNNMYYKEFDTFNDAKSNLISRFDKSVESAALNSGVLFMNLETLLNRFNETFSIDSDKSFINTDEWWIIPIVINEVKKSSIPRVLLDNLDSYAEDDGSFLKSKIYAVLFDSVHSASLHKDVLLFGNMEDAKKSMNSYFKEEMKYFEENFDANDIMFSKSGAGCSIHIDGKYSEYHLEIKILEREIG